MVIYSVHRRRQSTAGYTVKQYLIFLGRELISPINYILALGVGIFIQLLQGSPLFSSLVPFLVPVGVQAFSKSVLRYTNRFGNMLLSLPGKREDPVFIMAGDGTIVASTGKTEQLFTEREVGSLFDLLGKTEGESVLSTISGTEENAFPLKLERYSPLLESWYRLVINTDGSGSKLLVWLDDISGRKRAYGALTSLHGFTDAVLRNLEDVAEEGSAFQGIASLALDFGFQGVLIAKVSEKSGNLLEGHVYRNDNDEIVHSGLLTIHREADAPVWRSRESGKVTYDQLLPGESEEAFFMRYPFDKQVAAFIGEPIRSFINYHEGEVSIIAFNLDHRIESEDILALEIVVNSARSVSSLVDLARVNDKKFYQGVTGLCSAAEYSDEITGLHIYRVNEYSRFLAEKVGMDQKEQKWIGMVASMHDIGKVAIPHLIKLDRAFTPEERYEMEMHVIYGAQIIGRMMNCCDDADPRLDMAREIALYHHQRWDGQGYPGLYAENGGYTDLESRNYRDYLQLRPAKGDEIPLTARIVSLADTYDALRSPRQYKPAMPHEKACTIIRLDDRSGARGVERFGEDLMELFEEHHRVFAEIFESMQDV